MPLRMNRDGGHADCQPVATDAAAPECLQEHDRVNMADTIRFGLCAATTGMTRNLVMIADIDALGAGFRQNVIGRPDVVFTSPCQPLGQRVATAAAPTLLGAVAATRAIHARKRLRQVLIVGSWNADWQASGQ